MAEHNERTIIKAENYRRTLKYLDDLFRSLKFKRRMGMNFVRYIGKFNGRSATVKIPSDIKDSLVKRQLSTLLDRTIVFEVSTSIRTRLLFLPAEEEVDGKLGDMFEGATTSYQKANKNEQIVGLESEYSGYNIWANDPDWGRAFLDDTAVQELLHPHLYNPSGNITRNGVGFTPTHCTLDVSTPPVTLTVDFIQKQLTLISKLAAEAEKSPPISEVKQSGLERFTKMDKPVLIILFVVVGLGIILPSCCALIFFLTRLSQLT